MHINETEITLPLIISKESKSLSRRGILSLCILGIFLLGAGILLLILHGKPTAIISRELLAILLIILSILILLPSVTMLTLRGNSSRPPHFVRIDHEGIFLSRHVPIVVKWNEISALVPYTWIYLGNLHTDLGIVLRNPDVIISKIIKGRQKTFCYSFS